MDYYGHGRRPRDFYDEGYSRRDKEHRDYDGPPRPRVRRRFDKYRVTGMLLMIFGVSIFVLGVFDVGWVVSRYGNNCQPDPAGVYDICGGNHIFIYIGTALWGGAMVIFVAFISLGIHPDKASNRTAHRNFVFFLAIIMLLILPAIIVLHSLEVSNGYNKYWMYVNGSITGYDLLQIGLPISVAILAGLSFNVILFFMVFLYCCSDDRYGPQYGPRYPSDSDISEESYRGRSWAQDPYRHYYNRGRDFRGGLGGKRYYYN